MPEVPDGVHPFLSKTAIWHGAGAHQAAATFHQDYEEAVDAAYRERQQRAPEGR